MTAQYKYDRIDVGDETRLRLLGKLDVLTVFAFHRLATTLVAENRRLIWVDLKDLDLIDSAGVAAIVSLYRRIHIAGGQVHVIGLRNQPLAVFQLLRLDRALGCELATAPAGVGAAEKML